MVCLQNLFFLSSLLVLDISAWNASPINTKSRLKWSSTKIFLSDQLDDDENDEYDTVESEMAKKQMQLEIDMTDDGFFDKPLTGSEIERRRRIREVLSARAKAKDIKKADLTGLKELQERSVKRTLAARNRGFDLNEFTDTPEETKEEEIDPEDVMTEEEKREADPLSFEPVWVWFYEDLKKIKWVPFKRVVEAGIKLVILGFISREGLKFSDRQIENFMLDIGKFPSRTDIDAARNKRLQMAKELANEATSPGNLNLPPINEATNPGNLNLPPISPP
mmetsp:Transcript_19392/g.22167  ORF Transcript_19392/g.22167 Transcript_19392/m.22167 type:complete len:278 (-) Transcript_19392:260-1093(-)|eukprot:CAMPEP_0194131682 /NCGR_PEP_ID=MMETSP0152-20130528/2399_1 /TAXON_ID=1049557 /ORGANISM="Thalassiothrix antarctica, Strain L6-D1" /LENGTH=277 /DNA_ID=CAMNT_0038826543 /DNA_START=177 /DNA_END=1010 /DNA_ORIENTATION=+